MPVETVWFPLWPKPPRVYFMYPLAEPQGRIDPFDPDNFKYEISVKELGQPRLNRQVTPLLCVQW